MFGEERTKDIIAVGMVLIAAAFVFFFAVSSFKTPEEEYACTMEAKLCPDGSAVGRQGPNCEFAQCPQEGSKNQELGSTVDMSDWKAYRNEQFGFGFLYPSDWGVELEPYWDAVAQREIPNAEIFIKSPSKKWSL